MNMTIKQRTLIAGIIIFILFVIIAVINLRMHQEVLSNLNLRDDVRHQQRDIQEYAEWKNDLILFVSDAVASGHVPSLLEDRIKLSAEPYYEESRELIKNAKMLVSLIGDHREKIREADKKFSVMVDEINELYYKLDKKISTVLARIQMDQVLGRDSGDQTALAPYVLKSLNQLTLIALNSIMSRNYALPVKSRVEQNMKFLSSQLPIIDTDGTIRKLFESLFLQIQRLEKYIPESNRIISTFESEIKEAKSRFNKTLSKTDTDRIIVAAEAEVKAADRRLINTSRHTLITAVIFLLVIPLLVILFGIFGMNRLIVRPISYLANAMKNVEKGDFNVEVQIKRDDEIGELAKTFNIMASEINRKITDLALLNDSLKESESKYRTLVENLPQGIFLKNKKLEYVSCNHKYAMDIGLNETDIAGKTDFDLFSKKRADEIRKSDEKILSNPELNETEQSYIRNGKVHYFLVVKTPVWDKQGDVSGLLGIYSDITERKEAETELVRLMSAIEQVVEIIVITDKDGAIQYVNPSFETVTGYKSDEVKGRNPRILKSDKQDEAFYKNLWETITSGGTWQGHIVNRKKDGSLYTEEATVSPVLDEAGDIINFVAVKRDITEELNLKKRIEQAQKMEAIGSLAGGIAHDFNNLLSPIIGISELLLEDFPPDSPEHENLLEILNAGKRGADLVKQILAFSRQTEHQMIPVQVQQVVKEVLKLSRAAIPTDIELIQNIQSDCGPVLADPTQVHQIAMNLITNAYHACESVGGGSISVAVTQVAIAPDDNIKGSRLEPGPYAVLSVSDTGCGIDPAVVDKIFDPYFTTKAFGKGTGLGLATVYGIVLQHRGDIRVTSELGHGTTFTIYLPLMKKTVDIEAAKPAADPVGGNERVLLVDDDEAVARLTLRVLERLGYRVTMHTSSLEALKAFRADPEAYRLLVTDMSMPQMTGDRLAEAVAAIRPDMPIIICTGFSERISMKKARTIGIDGLLMKPVLKSELGHMVRKAIDERAKHLR